MVMRILLLALAACASEAAMTQPDADCRVLFDFSKEADRDAWSVQNDTVMGGNSSGSLVAEDGALVFEGRLVTRGGGFVQINAPLPDGVLEGVGSLRVTGTSEGRSWRARVETDERVPRDAMRGGEEGSGAIRRSGPELGGPRVAFSAPIEGLGTGEPATGTADMTNPEATSRGRPVPGATWNPAAASSLGLILADGEDARFRLRVERIEACG